MFSVDYASFCKNFYGRHLMKTKIFSCLRPLYSADCASMDSHEQEQHKDTYYAANTEQVLNLCDIISVKCTP